jgi:hypothetical protein
MIAKWLYRHSSQDVCPWNARFSTELPHDSPYAPREVLAGEDARTLAREILGIAPARQRRLADRPRAARLPIGLAR